MSFIFFNLVIVSLKFSAPHIDNIIDRIQKSKQVQNGTDLDHDGKRKT